MTLASRLWAKVARLPNGCWLWTARKNNRGYGEIYVGPGRSAPPALARRRLAEIGL